MGTNGNVRVLYVEDDPDSRTMVAYILKKASIDVEMADSGPEAWRLVSSMRFDAFLLDGALPGDDGLALCRQLRKFAPETPIIFYSALAYDRDIERGLAAGANVYLVKPYGGDLAMAIFDAIGDRSKAPTGETSRAAPYKSRMTRFRRRNGRPSTGIL